MLTDSKSLFDIITKCCGTTEKRLLIELKDVREAYEKIEISDLAFVRSGNNTADAITKKNPNSALLRIIERNKCDFLIEQWILRTKRKNSD